MVLKKLWPQIHTDEEGSGFSCNSEHRPVACTASGEILGSIRFSVFQTYWAHRLESLCSGHRRICR
jgi:hypothetical protein